MKIFRLEIGKNRTPLTTCFLLELLELKYSVYNRHLPIMRCQALDPSTGKTPMKWGSRALPVCLLAPPLDLSPLIRKQRLKEKQLYPTPLWGRRKQNLSFYPQSFNNSRASKSQVRSCFTVLGSWRSCSLPHQNQLPFPQSCSISNGKISNLRAQNISAYCAIFL